MLTVILILTAVFIYYLYKQKYGYWQRRGESPDELILFGCIMQSNKLILMDQEF